MTALVRLPVVEKRRNVPALDSRGVQRLDNEGNPLTEDVWVEVPTYVNPVAVSHVESAGTNFSAVVMLSVETGYQSSRSQRLICKGTTEATVARLYGEEM